MLGDDPFVKWPTVDRNVIDYYGQHEIADDHHVSDVRMRRRACRPGSGKQYDRLRH